LADRAGPKLYALAPGGEEDGEGGEEGLSFLWFTGVPLRR